MLHLNFCILAPPKFKAEQSSKETIEVGYGFILSIPVYSKSDIHIDWIKSTETNSTPILNITNAQLSWNIYGERVSVPGYRANVYIEQIQSDDAGMYQANVTNTQGSSLIDIQLDIGGKLVIPKL